MSLTDVKLRFIEPSLNTVRGCPVRPAIANLGRTNPSSGFCLIPVTLKGLII